MTDGGSHDGGPSRRRFVSGLLGAAAAGYLSVAWPIGRSASRATAAASRSATLTAFLDTLIPADALSGSASDLGIPALIVRESARDALYAKLIRVGCRWLDRAAEGSFAESPPRVREVVVAWMAQADWNEVPRRFYELLRQRTVTLYYSRVEGWGGLPIRHPPQPYGYPEPWA